MTEESQDTEMDEFPFSPTLQDRLYNGVIRMDPLDTINEYLNQYQPTSCPYTIQVDSQTHPHNRNPNTSLEPFIDAASEYINTTVNDTIIEWKHGIYKRKKSDIGMEASQHIIELAIEYKVTEGKWMLDISPNQVDTIWNILALATYQSILGPKITVTYLPSRRIYHIDIYTVDFTDIDDVDRVLKEVRRLGLEEWGLRPLGYKPCCFSMLGIRFGNVWGIDTILYRQNEE
ncbi:hypothetical protein BC833DRAFT_602332 [Globomyces pollinis-pini]|nr:hypothetical protein BC833DRAFT_602332 [Globomyces pollinis-pini]